MKHGPPAAGGQPHSSPGRPIELGGRGFGIRFLAAKTAKELLENNTSNIQSQRPPTKNYRPPRPIENTKYLLQVAWHEGSAKYIVVKGSLVADYVSENAVTLWEKYIISSNFLQNLVNSYRNELENSVLKYCTSIKDRTAYLA